VPVTGVIDDDGELGAISDPRTQVRPLARTVGDVRLVLSVIAGAAPHEPDIPSVVLGDAREVELRRLRALVVYQNDLVAPTDVYGLFRRWDAYRRRILGVLEPYGLILSPTFDGPAPRHDEVEEEGTWDRNRRSNTPARRPDRRPPLARSRRARRRHLRRGRGRRLAAAGPY
jgi:Asp-tRNA(Asn)/Glu-tRNA(Gln) amidotransferase A subunit family amidase